MNPTQSTVPAEWLRDGWTRLGRILTEHQCAIVRDALDHYYGEEPELGQYGVLDHNLWERIEPLADVIRSGTLAAHARRLLGVEEVLMFQDNFIWKIPEHPSIIDWHQDYSYWPLASARGLVTWLTFDDADAENGCLRYLPGTHTLGERQPADFVAGVGHIPREDLPPLDWQSRLGSMVELPCRAGEALAHHPLLWHMSPPNRSRRHRRALAISWIAAGVCWDPDHAPHPYNWYEHPVTGEPVEGERFLRFSASGGTSA